MEKILVTVLCLGLSFGTATAQADEFKNLDAQYRLSTKDLIDPNPRDIRDRVSIYIEGESAKEIYDAMLGRARRINCDGTSSKEPYFTKRAGGLECSLDEKAKTYHCSVAIKLDTGETDDAEVCN